MVTKHFFMSCIAVAAMVYCPLHSDAQRSASESSENTGALFRPKINLGTGVLTYMGDVGHLNGMSKRSHLNWGQNIMMRNPIDDAFDLNVFALFGTITGEERLQIDHYNFRTSVRMGGLSVSYNFNHLLPADRMITPFVSVGITTFEFNPKGDRKDALGRSYHHWSDGRVMSLPETHSNAENAIPLTQNNDFETDLRSAENGNAPYSLRGVSIPVSAGVDLELSDKFSLRLSAEYHFTNTDYLDGIANDPGSENGRAGNDRFLYSSAGLTYNLHHTKNSNARLFDNSSYALPSPENDEDGDGVPDMYDLCPGTEDGIQVDVNGCPIDSDGDGVPDHVDQESGTAKGAPVNGSGIGLSDKDFEYMYQVYMGEVYAQNFEKSSTSTADVDKVKLGSRTKGFTLTVRDLESLSANELSQILSIPNIKSRESDGRMEYYMGEYETTSELVEAAIHLTNAGLDYDITYRNMNKVTALDQSFVEENALYEAYNALHADDKVTFRVQIGAFSKAVSPKLFKDIPNVLVTPGDDGLTRYISGSYTNIQDAAKHRVDLLLKGYEGAFVTAYRNGKRLTLKEAGATVTNSEETETKRENADQINKKFVSYALQLGTFKGRIPAETLSKYMALGNVRPIRSEDGTTRYLHGTYNTMQAAQKSVQELVEQGFADAFAVGEFNGQIIPANEAFDIRGE